jgi:acid phosphatase family membrane protein YuiD
MEWLSKYLVAIVAAWAIANLIKVAINFRREKKISKTPVLTTGGMPSAHTATVVALTTTIMLVDGLASVAFAIAFLFTVNTTIDALQFRRATGENGLAIQKLLPKSEKKPYLAIGHRPVEVFVGGVIGLVVGVATAILM